MEQNNRMRCVLTTTHRRRHGLTRIALVTAVAIFSAGGCFSWGGYSGSANHSLDDQLIEAADDGNTALIEDLLDRGADIEARDDDGWNALMSASYYGQVAVVELLLDRGADIEARSNSGNTALSWASKKGHDEVAAVLRAWAAKPGGRQDTSPTLAQSQEPAPAAQATRPSTPPPPPAEPPVEQNKTALLIANASYDHFPKLRTPLQEARQLGAALKRIGFEVEMLTDGSQYEMREALYRFEERVRERGGTALFHYGGHGIQVNGVNYLLPVDQNIPDERRVRGDVYEESGRKQTPVDYNQLFTEVYLAGGAR